MIIMLVASVFYPVKAQVHLEFTYPDRKALVSDGWDFTAKTATGAARNTEQTTGAVVSYDQLIHPGVLRIPVDNGDLWEGINNTKNCLFRDLPGEWTSIRLKIVSFNPSQNNQQATLAAYQDDDNYVQVSRTFEVSNCIMFTSEKAGNAVNLNTLPETATTNIFLRLDRDPASETITSYYSLDGIDWIQTGTVVQQLVNPRFCIETGASPGGFPEADFGWAEISTQPLPPITDELRAHPGAIVFNARKGVLLSEKRSLFIFSAMGKIIGWKQSSDASWITCDTENGLTDAVLKIGVNTSGLEPGLYHGNIKLESVQSTGEPVIIPVSLIVNPNVPVKISLWKDGVDGAMSVSVDDGQPSGYDELSKNGFKGTYVTNGTTPPAFYTAYYNAGMELGSHLVNHPCNTVSDLNLKFQEILPNITNLCAYTPLLPDKLISLVWPCGYTNYREQAVASEYFMSARGYNINQLEDATPDNFMNLKSYNSHEHTPFPPSDLKPLVDSAVSHHKWFNLVLHNMTNDDGAITYAKSKNIWVAPIGTIIKYIIQRDGVILSNYSEASDNVSFAVSRLPVPSTASREFEKSFGVEDIVTMEIDIEDNRLVENVVIDGVINSFRTEKSEGNIILFTNVRLEPGMEKPVRINFRSEYAVPVSLNPDILNFNTVVNRNPDNQSLAILTQGADPVRWNASVNGSGQNWRLSITPNSGLLNDTIMISVNSSGLPVGNYRKTITISSPDGIFYPFEIEVNLEVNPNLLHQNYPNPFNAFTWIEYDLPEEGPVSMELYNLQGIKCRSLVSDYMVPGNYKIKFESGNFSSGIYFLVMRTKSFTETIKISILK
ncbi:MAG: T9SS type A sorting domain-containing protein [Bacteroidales bacterium]|nr:T9SS type A sorting domain-containing protein [Bacteroidales bacterium]